MLDPNNKPYGQIKRYSIFSGRVRTSDPRKTATIGYISISQYCKEKFISRSVLNTFAKKGWVAVIKTHRSRISVVELCPEEIEDYLMY